MRVADWLRRFFDWRDAVGREIDEELRFHLDLRVVELVAQGLAPKEARREALRRFGDPDEIRRECLEEHPPLEKRRKGDGLMSNFWQDLRYGLRTLGKAPGFTIVAVLTLALGIGANTAIFSMLNGVLLRPLRYPESERLVWFWEKQPDLDNAPFSAPDFLDYQSQNQTFENMAGVRPLNFNLTGQGEPERIRGGVVSANFFTMLKVAPALGRGFLSADGQAGAGRVALLSHGFWQRRFGGDPKVVGQAITLNEERVTIVGVMPPKFEFIRDVEVWLNPKRIVPEVFANFKDDHLTARGMHYLSVLGRLKPGVTLGQAQADVDRIVAGLQKQYTSNAGHSVRLITLHEQAVGDVRSTLLALAAAVGLVLLIGCANVANLLLARATARQREIAIRTALGAGRGRIVRQLLTESLLLALMGGGVGLALAYWGVDALAAAGPGLIPRAGEIRVDLSVLGFTLAVSLAAGLVFGIAPSVEASRTGLSEVLKEGGRSGTAGVQRHRLRGLLVVTEVALSLVLLTGAGLLLRSMVSLLEVKPGFQPDNLVTMWVSFSSSKYSQTSRTGQFVDELIPRLESLPGVQGVALSNDLPLEGQDTTTYPRISGRPTGGKDQQIVVGVHVVNPAYFRAMGIPLLKGRPFNNRDTANAPPVVIVNESAAKKLWPGEDPIGKRLGLLGSDNDKPGEVVGVVADVKHNGLNAPPSLDSYLPFAQTPWAYAGIVLRTTTDSASALAAVRKEVLIIDPDQPVFAARTMHQVMAETIQTRRATLILSGLFAGLALVLAAVGIYGVMSYGVTQRWHEIGIRMALGAQRGDIARLVVGQGLGLALVGIAVGVLGAFWVTRFLSGLLFGVKPSDPLTFAAVAFLLAMVAALACWVPARRATRVDPMIALRYE